MAEPSTPTPIHKVLFLIQKNGVHSLLMGGQACILYGAAEFSKDIDLSLHISPENLVAFAGFLQDIDAQVIAVPPFEVRFLERGHAIHFRAQDPSLAQLRVDIMTRMRGVDEFELLWTRRTSIEILPALGIEVMSLPDLVKAKKTQRDKDWPMIRRLVEVDYFNHRGEPSAEQTAFWLMELRTPELLLELKSRFPKEAKQFARSRSLLALNDLQALSAALEQEMNDERAKDRAYWQPLKRELEELRHKVR